jgi:hypothetical protein
MPMSTRGLCRFAFGLQSLASEVLALAYCNFQVAHGDTLACYMIHSDDLIFYLSAGMGRTARVHPPYAAAFLEGTLH